MEFFVVLCGIIMAVLVQFSSATGQNLVAVEAAAKLPYSSAAHSTLYDGKDSIYIFGGRGQGGAGDSSNRRIHKYDIQNDRISEVGSFPEALYDGCATFDRDGNILYMGATKLWSETMESQIYKFDVSTGNLSVVGNVLFGKGSSVIRAVDETNTILIAGNERDGTVYCLNLENFQSCGFIFLISTYYWNIRSFVYGNHAYLTGSYYTGSIETLNLDTFASETINPGLPDLRNHDIVFDGAYAYILGLGNRPRNGLIKLNPENFEHEFIQVDNFPVNQSNIDSWWWLGSAVYVEPMNRIYFIGGTTQPGENYRDEIWYIDLSDPGLTEGPISTTTIPTETTFGPTDMPISSTINPEIFTCLGKPNGMYPHPYDCAKFIGCRNEIATIYECLPPLLFSPIHLTCKVDVECDLSCINKLDGLYAHPHSCNLFIDCHDEIVEVSKCPDELLFDPETKRCNFPDEVQCNND